MIPMSMFYEEHEQIRTMARQFITKEILPDYAYWERDVIVVHDIWCRIGEVGILWPTFRKPTEARTATSCTVRWSSRRWHGRLRWPRCSTSSPRLFPPTS